MQEYSKDPDGVASGEAERLWLRVLQGAELVLRENHPHFAIIWDNIAQVRFPCCNFCARMIADEAWLPCPDSCGYLV